MALLMETGDYFIDNDSGRKAKVEYITPIFDTLKITFSYTDEPPEHYVLNEEEFLRGFTKMKGE